MFGLIYEELVEVVYTWVVRLGENQDLIRETTLRESCLCSLCECLCDCGTELGRSSSDPRVSVRVS